MSYVIQRGPQFYHPAGWRTLAGQRGELQVMEMPR